MSACHGNCNQGRLCDCAPCQPSTTQRTTMKKLLADFVYYIRRGHDIRTAWRLARVTL